MNPALFDSLQKLLGSKFTGKPTDLQASQADWSGQNPTLPVALAKPETTEQLAEILRLCNDYQQAVVTQGGLTGLSGGATPQKDELAISLQAMRGIIELDEKGLCIVVKAGTPLEEVQQAANELGLVLPLDLGARGSCTIGGNVATNAGGNQVIKYGMARSLVLGLEAVTAQGTIIRAMNRMLKNNAGYDLKHLFIGSEGTLGIITEVVLRLYPKPPAKLTALCSCNSFDQVITLLQNSQRKFGGVSAFEVMWESYYHYAIDKVEHTRNPFSTAHNYYVLLEVESGGSKYAENEFLEHLATELESGLLSDVMVSQSERETNDFWAIRDAIGEIIPMLDPISNFDIGVPISNMEAFISDVTSHLNKEYNNLTLLVFGHVGDGNLHITATTGEMSNKNPIYARTYEIASKYGATVTAEHGVGVQKKQYLHYSRTQEELAMMSTLKTALDPNNILNPGRVIN